MEYFESAADHACNDTGIFPNVPARNRKLSGLPLTGQALFDFMNNATHMSMYSVLDNGALIKKIYVPKYIFTLSKVTSSLIDLIFSMGALILVMLITRAPFSPYILLFPLVVIPLYIFVCGLGFFLSAANVFFRDIQYIYNAITVAWMYVTPMFYPIELLPDWLRKHVEYCNPCFIIPVLQRSCFIQTFYNSKNLYWLLGNGFYHAVNWTWCI